MVVIVWYVFVSTLTVFSATGVVIVVVELGEVDKHCLFAGLWLWWLSVIVAELADMVGWLIESVVLIGLEMKLLADDDDGDNVDWPMGSVPQLVVPASDDMATEVIAVVTTVAVDDATLA